MTVPEALIGPEPIDVTGQVRYAALAMSIIDEAVTNERKVIGVPGTWKGHDVTVLVVIPPKELVPDEVALSTEIVTGAEIVTLPVAILLTEGQEFDLKIDESVGKAVLNPAYKGGTVS